MASSHHGEGPPNAEPGAPGLEVRDVSADRLAVADALGVRLAPPEDDDGVGEDTSIEELAAASVVAGFVVEMIFGARWHVAIRTIPSPRWTPSR
jgi:hypothetical protein